MGTNYYKVCKFCGQEILHIGKHSNNEFLSNMTEEGVKKLYFEHYEILKDEYGRTLTLEQMFKKIPNKWNIIDGDFF